LAMLDLVKKPWKAQILELSALGWRRRK